MSISANIMEFVSYDHPRSQSDQLCSSYILGPREAIYRRIIARPSEKKVATASDTHRGMIAQLVSGASGDLLQAFCLLSSRRCGVNMYFRLVRTIHVPYPQSFGFREFVFKNFPSQLPAIATIRILVPPGVV